MKKRFLGVALAAVLAFTAIAGSIATASAADVAPPNPNRLPEYTPSSGVETITVKFAMPGFWTGAEGTDARTTWEKYGSTSGLYWWGSMDNPDDAPDAAGHGWPGWKMKKDGSVVNLYSSLAPKGTASMIFSNFIDGGMDTSYPEYDAALQTMDLTMLEYFGEGDSDYYPKEFWDYIYDNYYENMADDPTFQITEFGEYAKNFFYSEDDDSIYHYIDDMVFVVDTVNTDRAMVSPVSGKAGLDGAFYFYYGNGEFGIWPTREMCIEKEGLTVDAEGNIVYEGTKTNAETGEEEAFTETVQEKTGFILRNHEDAFRAGEMKDFVVFGNFTGKYWEDTVAPEVPTNPATEEVATTVPAPDNNDATSAEGDKSTSGSGSNDSNGSIATGEFSVAALIGVVAIAGLGVFYFVRKRRSSK